MMGQLKNVGIFVLFAVIPAASVCWLDAEFVAEDSINTFFTVVDIV